MYLSNHLHSKNNKIHTFKAFVRTIIHQNIDRFLAKIEICQRRILRNFFKGTSFFLLIDFNQS